MKKRIVRVIAFLAILTSGASSVGCPWCSIDEPDMFEQFCD